MPGPGMPCLLLGKGSGFRGEAFYADSTLYPTQVSNPRIDGSGIFSTSSTCMPIMARAMQVLLNGNPCMVVGPGGAQGPSAGGSMGALTSSGVQAASVSSLGVRH